MIGRPRLSSSLRSRPVIRADYEAAALSIISGRLIWMDTWHHRGAQCLLQYFLLFSCRHPRLMSSCLPLWKEAQMMHHPKTSEFNKFFCSNAHYRPKVWDGVDADGSVFAAEALQPYGWQLHAPPRRKLLQSPGMLLYSPLSVSYNGKTCILFRARKLAIRYRNHSLVDLTERTFSPDAPVDTKGSFCSKDKAM
ncbi:hypothetical protein cypCar_00032832 [Cyprinus carpio]|nr:hypothetical protein cypCar_00032832 [Cyprinus carpio]